MISRRALLPAGLGAALGLFALRQLLAPAISEEERIRETLLALAESVRRGDLGGVMPRISKSYRDADGLSRDQLRAFLFREFKRREGLAVVMGPIEVQLEEGEDRAVARFDAALADGIDLLEMDWVPESAEAYEFTVQLVSEEGEWQVSGHERSAL